MRTEDLERWSKIAAEWSANYFAGLRDRPVVSKLQPGSVAERIPPEPPEQAEPMEVIFRDFERLIPDGMTHWQHPRFFAYFPANAAPASILAEQLANSMAAQCMLWQTSPAATELETVMVDWLRSAVGLPREFSGVLQDTATSATLCAVLTMRERALGWKGLIEGLQSQPVLRIYASDQNHSSIDKAVRLAGIGQNNLVKIATDSSYALRADHLEEAIQRDREAGFLPAGIIGCMGGTSIGACDRLQDVLSIARREHLYAHVDAAWAGSAMICPELRPAWEGVEMADSIVINPHKWLGANFDCCVQLLRTPEQQIRTLALRPDYLKTFPAGSVTNYSEWTIPLGRRFRALKLWFLFRAYGLEGLRQRIRNHIDWARWAADRIALSPCLEIVTQPSFSLFTFRFNPPNRDSNTATRELLQTIQSEGVVYLSHTMHGSQFAIRFCVGQFDTTKEDVEAAVNAIQRLSQKLSAATF